MILLDLDNVFQAINSFQRHFRLLMKHISSFKLIQEILSKPLVCVQKKIKIMFGRNDVWLKILKQ